MSKSKNYLVRTKEISTVEYIVAYEGDSTDPDVIFNEGTVVETVYEGDNMVDEVVSAEEVKGEW